VQEHHSKCSTFSFLNMGLEGCQLYLLIPADH